jgi:FkbH-like protein
MNTIAEIKAAQPSFRYADYVRHVPALEVAAADGRPLRVAVLRSYTVEAIEPVLKLRLLLDGFRPALWFGGYNQYVQEVMNPHSGLHEFRPDLVLLLIRLEETMPDLVDDFPAKRGSAWEEEIAAKAMELSALVARLQDRFPAQVIVQNMTPPRAAYFGAYDPQHPDGQRYLIERFNEALAAELAKRKGAFVWDFDRFVRAIGYDQLFDPKAWYVSRNPYKQAAYPAIAEDLMRYVRSALGRLKKCVVVDLDNTLWGGIAGEDGLEGIALGHSYPGNCYRDFQKALLKLYHRGILLAINSKNNADDAFRIIDEHPDMVLRRQHFAAYRINWGDKATNLRDLARELNIGLDAFTFLDDSPVECELVRQACPECDVVLLPEKPYLLPDVPARLWGVENVALTEEDRQKGALYRARAARQEHAQRYENLNEFLRSLEIEVEIEPATSFSIPRIAQLTQKTNQMNMTTRRYTEAQIEAFAGDPAYAVFSVASRDRFGADGIVGVFILRFDGHACWIDTFLLSCRVIGRGIEQLMVAFIAEVAGKKRAQTVVGEFFPTAKNHPAAGLYETLGFRRTGDTELRIDVGQASIPYPAHVRLAGPGTASARA